MKMQQVKLNCEDRERHLQSMLTLGERKNLKSVIWTPLSKSKMNPKQTEGRK